MFRPDGISFFAMYGVLCFADDVAAYGDPFGYKAAPASVWCAPRLPKTDDHVPTGRQVSLLFG